jgi:hypothetical protein
MSKTTTHTGISSEQFTLPDGRDLPPFNIETEGQELIEWLFEIDRAMNNTPWGVYADQHQGWWDAWTGQFFEIRKALGAFDPYGSYI